MKKYLQLICLTFVVLIVGAGMKLFCSFPIDAQPYVEKKYEGWNGVLQAWVCTNWSPGGSFIRWLNSCAAEFEKQHEGVYLEFTPVQADTIRSIGSNELPAPNLVFFSPGIITDREMLMNVQSSTAIRSDLSSYGAGHALPVALGGYIWAYNTALCAQAPGDPTAFSALGLPDQILRTPLIGLLSGSQADGNAELIPPESGIDLGLTVSAVDDAQSPIDALDMFIDGELACIPVDSKDIARLTKLRENAAGPDWLLAATGEIACTNQLLLSGIPVQHVGSEQAALAEEFLNLLLTEEMQAELADIGACSVRGTRIHSDFSTYAELDILLNSRPLWVPDGFSEYSVSDSKAIVREFLQGNFPAKNALRLMGFEGM